MPRIDKVIQIVRGKAGTVFPADGLIKGVVVGAGGSVYPSGASNADGVTIVNDNRGPYGTALFAGDRIDVLIQGEIVEVGGTAGDRLYAGAAGSVTTTNTGKAIGPIMDGGKRLIVNI